jgi:hypothetical protein
VSLCLAAHPAGIDATVQAFVLITSFAQSAAVQDNEFEIAAARLVMKATSNELLAGLGLAADEHWNGGTGKQPYRFA